MLQSALSYENNDSNTQVQLGPNPYEKLEISLSSGLRNEVDFVINSLVLMSSDEVIEFKLYQSPRLIDLMLGHVGFFGSSNDESRTDLRNLYDKVWNPIDDEDRNDNDCHEFKTFKTRRNFIKFWNLLTKLPEETIDQQQEQQQIDINLEEDKLMKHHEMIRELIPHMSNNYLNSLPDDDLLNLKKMPDIHSRYANAFATELRRIEQVLVILNNASFSEKNADFLANKSPLILEFLILCIYSTLESVRTVALDILVNLSQKIKLKYLNDKHIYLLFMALTHLITGHEKLEESTALIPNKDETTSNGSSGLIQKTIALPALNRIEIARGLEVLAKLFTFPLVDVSAENIENYFINERIVSQYVLQPDNLPFVERVLIRIESLLSLKDMLIIMECLECLYQMTQSSKTICDLIVSFDSTVSVTGYLDSQPEQWEQQRFSVNTPSKMISILVDFLTLDMSHFGGSNTPINHNNGSSSNVNQVKFVKVLPSNNNNSSNNNNKQVMNQPIRIISNNHQTTLLQQTLNHQQNKSVVSLQQKVLAPSSSNTSSSSSSSNQNESQAKSILINWLTTCFQPDSGSELSKTQLYPYYQQIAKLNSWPVLVIPTFFELLNSTFPKLRYDDETNKIHGLKLVLTVKQQIENRQKQQQQQQKQQQNVAIKAKSTTPPLINSDPPLNPVVSINQITESNKIDTVTSKETTTQNNISICVSSPQIMPLLTPPERTTSITVDTPETLHKTEDEIVKKNESDECDSNEKINDKKDESKGDVGDQLAKPPSTTSTKVEEKASEDEEPTSTKRPVDNEYSQTDTKTEEESSKKLKTEEQKRKK
jgi:hypothetical protein